MRNLSGFLSVCYHYIREDKQNEFPRILGTTKKEFHEHLKMMKRDFSIINLDDVRDFFHNKKDQDFEESKLKDTRNLVEQNISDAFDFAKNSPFPSKTDLYEGVF